jgi:N-acetylneuraminate synthase
VYTCFAVVPMGARFLEKHVTLDKRSPGPDQSVSIDMRDLRELVDGTRKTFRLTNTHGSESADYEVRAWGEA